MWIELAWHRFVQCDGACANPWWAPAHANRYQAMTEEEQSYLRRAVPVINDQGRPYSVRLDAVPTPWRGALKEHIRRESIPLFSDGIGDCRRHPM